jgi:predicted nucleic acid-binding protein
MKDLLYFDTSALVKLIRQERESEALRTWLANHGHRARITTCHLAHAELPRALDAADHYAAQQLLTYPLSRDLLAHAGIFAAGTPLRSLHAIHATAALKLRDSCRYFVTYDKRQADAARLAGLEVAAPA